MAHDYKQGTELIPKALFVVNFLPLAHSHLTGNDRKAQPVKGHDT